MFERGRFISFILFIYRYSDFISKCKHKSTNKRYKQRHSRQTIKLKFCKLAALVCPTVYLSIQDSKTKCIFEIHYWPQVPNERSNPVGTLNILVKFSEYSAM